MTLKQFKWVDLLIFSVVAVIFEVINHFVTLSFSAFNIVFMSFTVVLTLISLYRWGISGIIVMVFSSIISVAISAHNTEYVYYITYILGGALGMIPGFIIFQIIIGRKKIKNNLIMIPYLLFDFILVILFRSLIISFFQPNFNDAFVTALQNSLVQESMSIFISCIILLVANRKKGNVVVEMNRYVKEVHELKKLGSLKELKEKPNFNSDNSFTEFGQIDNSTILDGGTMNAEQEKELLKMYDESANIKIDNPMDCLTGKQRKKKKDV